MMKVVHVTWVDPGFAQSGWMTRREFAAFVKDGLCRSETVGLLAHDGADMIVVVQNVGETQLAGAVKISRSAIKEIRTLAEVNVPLDLNLDA